MKFYLLCRDVLIINTDPQRRCYNGCHYSSRKEYGEWRPFLKYPFETREQAENNIRLFKRESLEFKIEERP